jgi:hypothetical protein
MQDKVEQMVMDIYTEKLIIKQIDLEGGEILRPSVTV